MGLTAEMAYAAALKKIKGVASGYDKAVRTGDNTFTIYFVNGDSVDLTIALPKDGVSITDVKIDANAHLEVTLSEIQTDGPGVARCC